MRDIKIHNCDLIYRGPQSEESPHLSFINLDGSARVDFDLSPAIRKIMFIGINAVKHIAAEENVERDKEMAYIKAYIVNFAEMIEHYNDKQE